MKKLGTYQYTPLDGGPPGFVRIHGYSEDKELVMLTFRSSPYDTTRGSATLCAIAWFDTVTLTEI